MKRTLISLALIAASSSSFALGLAAVVQPTSGTTQTVCAATAANNGVPNTNQTSVYGGSGPIPAANGTPVLIQQGFTVQCSANVDMAFQEKNAAGATDNGVVIAAASESGTQTFIGNSVGGSVAADTTAGHTTCTNKPYCNAGDVTTGITNALANLSAQNQANPNP